MCRIFYSRNIRSSMQLANKNRWTKGKLKKEKVSQILSPEEWWYFDKISNKVEFKSSILYIEKIIEYKPLRIEQKNSQGDSWIRKVN